MSTIKTVGEFQIDTTTGTVAGPAEYMRERGFARIDRIESGQDVCFNAGIRYSPDVYTAILVSLQTDFAGWKGQRQIAAMGR